MSRQIALSGIQIRSLKTFEVSFQKYTKELEAKGITPLPNFERVENPSYCLGKINRDGHTIANLLFQHETGEKIPNINKNGDILNGYAMLRGDEDYLKGGRLNSLTTNPIEHDRLDTYYGAEGTSAILRSLGFECPEYTVTEDCEVEFKATREIEEAVTQF